MGLFSRFRKTPDVAQEAESLGVEIAEVARNQGSTLLKTWRMQLDEGSLLALWAEFSAILVVFTDRLAYAKYAEPKRSILLNGVANAVRDIFAYARVGSDPKAYYEQLLAERMKAFALCPSIIGEGQQTLVSISAQHLVKTFFLPTPPRKTAELVLKTEKVVAAAFVALGSSPSFKRMFQELADSPFPQDGGGTAVV